jgi:flagellar FliJ protein
MERSRRIAAIADLEQHESDHAARALAESQRVLREREAVLADLRRYRDEYAGSRRPAHTQSIVAFQDFQRFLARLDEAVAWQDRLVAEAQRECEAQRTTWMTARSRALSLEKAVERCERIEQRVEARREQGRLDEAASRSGEHRAPRGGETPG